jgi:KUP system potassium uptake protein
VEQAAPEVWRGIAQFGFMERPDIPALLAEAHTTGCGIDPADLTYFVGFETVLPREDGQGLPGWVEGLYSFMQRNSVHVTDYFRLPADLVVEIGRAIAI